MIQNRLGMWRTSTNLWYNMVMNNQQDFNVKKIKVEEAVDFNPRKPKNKFRFRKKYIKIGLGVIAVIVLIFVATAFLKGWFSFSKDRVELEITAPTEISSGEEVEFSIRYKNNNKVVLKDVKLVIDYPQGAYSIDGNELSREVVEIEQVLPKEEGVKDFKIRLAGEKGSIKLLAVRLNYQPENISSRFENSTISKINIGSVLVGLYLTVPQKAISGEEVSYVLDYLNNTEEDFSNLKIELRYPSGFSFKTANPEPVEEKNIWQLEELKQGERGTIRVVGVLQGIEGENKTLEASIGKVENNKLLKYSHISSVTQIFSSPLLVSVFLNNEEEEADVSAKQRLNYKIKFKNNTDIALSQLVLKAYLEGEVFDFKTMILSEKGFFDSLNNVITWSAVGAPSLALLLPRESGEVKFSLSIKDSFSINNFDDKNFQISVRVELETFNVPPQFNLERLKIEKTLSSKTNSKVVLQAKGYHNETSVNINNYGPIPPLVNQTTTYTIHWQITNTSNDLENVRITAVLPQGIEWRNHYITLNKDTQVEYNERTKQIVWNIDRIPAGTGFLIPAYELVFQIALKPSIIQIGTIPVLIDESSLNGKDAFTEKTLESFSSAVATNLPDDMSLGFGGGRVEE